MQTLSEQSVSAEAPGILSTELMIFIYGRMEPDWVVCTAFKNLFDFGY